MSATLEEIAQKVREGGLEEAEQALASAGPTAGSQAEHLFLRALLHERRHEWEAALDGYDEALAAEPAHQEALFRAAVLHDRLGNDEEALALYERCAAQEQAPVSALINLAVLYEEEGRLDEARTCLESVLATYPEHARARQALRSVKASYTMYYDEKTQRDRELRSAVLDTPVTDFELSVRSRNCLKQMSIRTLGDLLRITEAELLSYKNFGETSLNEIKAMLSQKGLRLGQAVPGIGAPLPPAPVERRAGYDPALLMRPVADLELSVRARRCLQRLGVATIGELIEHKEAELTAMKNFGQTSLSEVKRQLSQFGLSLRTTE